MECNTTISDKYIISSSRIICNEEFNSTIIDWTFKYICKFKYTLSLNQSFLQSYDKVSKINSHDVDFVVPYYTESNHFKDTVYYSSIIISILFISFISAYISVRIGLDW